MIRPEIDILVINLWHKSIFIRTRPRSFLQGSSTLLVPTISLFFFVILSSIAGNNVYNNSFMQKIDDDLTTVLNAFVYMYVLLFPCIFFSDCRVPPENLIPQERRRRHVGRMIDHCTLCCFITTRLTMGRHPCLLGVDITLRFTFLRHMFSWLRD